MIFPVSCGLILPQNKNGSGIFEDLLIWLPHCPDLSPSETLWNVLDKQVWSKKELLLLTSWCQIPQQTYRAPVGSRPQWVTALLPAKGGPPQFWAAGHVDWCAWLILAVVTTMDWLLPWWHWKETSTLDIFKETGNSPDIWRKICESSAPVRTFQPSPNKADRHMWE